MNSTRPIRPRLHCKIDTAGFASVMIVLMVGMFFSTATLVPPHGDVAADLPAATHARPMPEAQREDAMIVFIGRHGEVFFDRDLIVNDQLPGLVRQRLNSGSEPRIYIRADARTPYGFVKSVLDGTGSAGIHNVAFLVEQRRFKPPH